jgi:2,3-bisphosphoglycerate-independent phosphoglycerate mutase
MYRGLARLVGMRVLPGGESITDQLNSLRRYYADYDFFFVHFKNTDARGEDGDFQAKVQSIEELDNALSSLLNLDPKVLIITGVIEFSERACLAGGMGRFPATEIMPLAMANALKLDKFGA